MSCCVKSTDVNPTATALEITVPEMTFQSCCKYRIVVCQPIPCPTLGLPVVIKSGADTIPLWTCGCAMPVLADYVKKQLCQGDTPCSRRYVIPVEYVNSGVETNPVHFTVTRRLRTCCDL